MNIGEMFRQAGVEVNLTLVILTAALLAARLLPIIIFSPFLGGEVLPTEIKIGLTVLFTIVLFPAVSGQIQHIPLSTLPFVGLILKEVFIGISLAFIIDLVFDAARSAGHLLDTASGANMAQLMVPQLQTQATIFSVLNYQVTVVFFLMLNGHHIIFNTLADSFVSLPLDAYPRFHDGAWPFFNVVLRVFGDLLSLSVSLSAPGLLATFLTDLALGFINRVAPQIQVYFIAMSIKPMVAAFMVLISIHLVLERLQKEFQGMLGRVAEALRLLG